MPTEKAELKAEEKKASLFRLVSGATGGNGDFPSLDLKEFLKLIHRINGLSSLLSSAFTVLSFKAGVVAGLF